MNLPAGTSRARLVWLTVLGVLASSCNEFSPRRAHPIEGTYDISMSFTGTERRGPCPPPETGYCYPNDGVAFTGSGVLTLSRASGPTGEATFVAEFQYNGQYYTADIASLETPTVTTTGSFTIPRFYADGLSWAEFEGGLNGDAMSGNVEIGVSVAARSIGTFDGQRRR